MRATTDLNGQGKLIYLDVQLNMTVAVFFISYAAEDICDASKSELPMIFYSLSIIYISDTDDDGAVFNTIF